VNPGGASTDIDFTLRRSSLEAVLNQNHANEELSFQLLDSSDRVVATGSSKRKIILTGLALGSYRYRVFGSISRAVDFTIKSTQGK
jgi:hypothetical protein